VYGEALNTHRAAIGLPPVDNVRDTVITDHPWLAADPVLARGRSRPTSTSCIPARGGCPTIARSRPRSRRSGRGRATVYVGFGSMPAPADAARAAVDAIRAHGHRAIVARGWAGLAPIDDGADCLAVGDVNQQALFPRVAAVVHHGGAGTTTTAAAAGAPQVVVPQMADQPYFAGRVADLGVGAAHDGPAPTAESLAAALGNALAAETRERATAVAGTIRADGAAVAAALLG
jgi:vancomycin aglycone glucosyltransferase